MPRTARNAPGGLIYHVLNRANGRLRLFKKEEDFLAFERVMKLAFERFPIRVLAWCFMSNHWHLVLWPQRDGDLTAFMPQTAAEVDALKQHIQRGRPFGDAQWMERTAQRLGLENTFRSPGRQMGWRKHAEADNEGP